MKKSILIVLCFMVLLSISVTHASGESTSQIDSRAQSDETELFNPRWFESFENYEYDKFDKTWIAHEIIEASEDAFLSISVMGDMTSVTRGGVTLGFYMFNDVGEQIAVKSADMLIDDKKYSYPYLYDADGSSFVRVGSKDKVLFIAFSEATEMSLRLIGTDGSKIIVDIPGEELARIRACAIKILDIDVWKYATDEGGEVAFCEENFPLIIE